MLRFRDFCSFLTFVIVILFDQSFIKNSDAFKIDEIDCSFYKTLENKLPFLKSKIEASFLLSTKDKIEPVEIGPNNWSGLKNSGFDPTKKSIIIIHGWKSSSTKEWIQNLTSRLHSVRNVNIFIVDWTKSCSNPNYIEVAERTPDVADLVVNFFKELRIQMTNSVFPSNEIQWNHLYFIGHSLGVHISGRAAYLLKEDNFWKVERITGLDPAKPCFVHSKEHNKIDKTDADFVDIIHSQVGHKAHVFAFGLNENLGHIDFYVDGGAIQPQCENFAMPWDIMKCSHKISHELFVRSVTNSTSNECALHGRHWDGNRKTAIKIFNSIKKNETCTDCPEMGLRSINSDKHGRFLVFTSELKPQCFGYNNHDDVKKALGKIES